MLIHGENFRFRNEASGASIKSGILSIHSFLKLLLLLFQEDTKGDRVVLGYGDGLGIILQGSLRRVVPGKRVTNWRAWRVRGDR